MDVRENIEHFCQYFDSEAQSIELVALGAHEDATDSSRGSESRYKKVLYLAAIDTLAGVHAKSIASVSRRAQNRERFINFIGQHGSWREENLVSIPFLHDELSALNLLGGSLGRYVDEKLAHYSTADGGSLPVVDIDDSVLDLLALASTDDERKTIQRYKHVELLYRYRNTLVHESREPGAAMDVFGPTTSPYYSGYIDDKAWYLTYPTHIFALILKRSISSFRSYLLEKSIDPFSLIEGTERW